MTTAFTCPQCLYATSARDVRFCPRCGLAREDAAPGALLELALAGGAVIVRDRLAYGDLCNLYHCTGPQPNRPGVFKIARSPVANRYVEHEAELLRRLRAADREQRFSPFLPAPSETLNYVVDDGTPARRATVLHYADGITSPDALYTLEEVRKSYPAGVDARDVAWMWRRLLTVLGYIHQQRWAHGAVTPAHVLIEPQEHKLVLIGWCGAVRFGQLPRLRPAAWGAWSRPEAAGPATDLAAAARTMQYLLGQESEPAVQRHLQRAAGTAAEAWALLADFDRLIEAAWGPRQFRPFVMPART